MDNQYTLEEIKTDKTVNNQPVYRKIIPVTLHFESIDSPVYINIDNLNVDTILSLEGVYLYNINASRNLNDYTYMTTCVIQNQKYIQITCSYEPWLPYVNDKESYLILEYTKKI